MLLIVIFDTSIMLTLQQVLSWCPVNDVASILGELLLAHGPAHPVYHIENPVRQPWNAMTGALAAALDIPATGIVPFAEWLRRVREAGPRVAAAENPAARLAGFFDKDFVRMSCGGLVLDTARAKQHSETMRQMGPVDEGLVGKYVQAWKRTGFLR